MPRDAIEDAADALAVRFRQLRARTLALTAPLSEADMTVQTMEDVSPAKWHMAHTTWFWETFLLAPRVKGYRPFDERFGFLFNSYYEQVGARHARHCRGELTRPDAETVRRYRAHVDAAASDWLASASEGERAEAATIVATGIAHEEQHQELLLTDIKHVLSRNPFDEAAYPGAAAPSGEAAPLDWIEHAGGLHEFGHEGEGMAFDNEGPRHKAWLEPFALASRPVTNAEYRAFIEDGGYRAAGLWLSDGWTLISEQARRAPFYWRERDGVWREYTLHGERDLDPHAPVSHLDYFEASAYAAWAGGRLPDEREWELAAGAADPAEGRWADPQGWLHPCAADAGFYGGVWEWTRSAYLAYPGYAPPEGAIGEYNGKFMCGQFVLRGGSCLTMPDHVRRTYRNFFPPAAQWQMTGLRLARDI
jgi:ergothioneine biosynthesis protein EgtB